MAASAAHRVHGMGTTFEAPTWPAITRDEAVRVLAHFPAAGDVVAIEWHSPRPFSAAALVRTTRGARLLKRHGAAVRSVAGLAEEHAFIAHLAAGGVAVPEVMTTAAGTGAIALGDACYELHGVAPGIDVYRERMSWTPFLSDAHAHAAGVALARMHSAARGFAAPARRVQPLVASLTILSYPDPMAATQAYVAARPAVAGFLAGRDWQAPLARLFAAFAPGLATLLAGRAPLWTHNDWHPSNLLWTPDGQVATVFDFGLADRTCAAHDIATAIERTAFDWLHLGQGADDRLGDPQSALALLAGYASVVPLARDEIRTIVRLLPLVHLEFALSEIDYFAGVVGDPAQAALALDGYLLGHAEWFLTLAGQAFLQRLDGIAC